MRRAGGRQVDTLLDRRCARPVGQTAALVTMSSCLIVGLAAERGRPIGRPVPM